VRVNDVDVVFMKSSGHPSYLYNRASANKTRYRKHGHGNLTALISFEHRTAAIQRKYLASVISCEVFKGSYSIQLRPPECSHAVDGMNYSQAGA